MVGRHQVGVRRWQTRQSQRMKGRLRLQAWEEAMTRSSKRKKA